MEGCRTVCLVVSAAPAPEGVVGLVGRLMGRGWRVVVVSTPAGLRFHDGAALAELTGVPVRSEYRMLGEGEALPRADVVLACPLTFNSLNKFAAGIADNFAVGLLCELVGYEVPTVVVPHCKPQLARHPGFQRSLQTLQAIPAVTLLHDPDAPYHNRMPSWREVAEVVHTVGRFD